MANLAFAPLVNAKVYRHFAAVTFAVTLCVAMFANGEARQAVNEPIVREQQTAELRKAEAQKFGAKRLGDRRFRVRKRGGFGEDFDPRYGDGYDPGGSAASSGTLPAEVDSVGGESVNRTASDPESGVLSPDEVAALSPEQHRAYLNRLRNRQPAAGDAVESRDLAAIEAGSLARSGSSAGD